MVATFFVHSVTVPMLTIILAVLVVALFSFPITEMSTLIPLRVEQSTGMPAGNHPDPYWEPVVWLWECELMLEEEAWPWWCIM